jgi:hypothetical protein
MKMKKGRKAKRKAILMKRQGGTRDKACKDDRAVEGKTS